MKTTATFCVWASNRPGVLLRLTTMFTRRKINIESLTVSDTAHHELSRFTILVRMEWSEALKLVRKIGEIVDVERASVEPDGSIYHREVALFRVSPNQKEKAYALAFESRARLIEEHDEFLLFEKTGEEHEIDLLLSRFRRIGLLEFMRSGRIACRRAWDGITDLSTASQESELQYLSIRETHNV